MGFFSDFFGGSGDSRPNFSNLGVTDPTTGKPVYLSANEIATVMGATGGVAPTKFQSTTEGFFQGAQQGLQFVQGVSQIQAQQENIRGQQIENDIAQQTKEATIQARNAQVKQQAIQARTQTEKMTNDNLVLDAIGTGDPQKLVEVISSDKTMLSALEQDQYVQAAVSKFRGTGQLTPQQAAAFDKFDITRNVFKAGPVQDQYNAAAVGVQGSLPFQMLQQKSGLDERTLLGQMQVTQIPPGGDPKAPFSSGPALIAPNGATVMLDGLDKDQTKLLSDFLGARAKVRNAGRPDMPFTAAPATQQTPAFTEKTIDVSGQGTPAALPPAAPNGVPAALPSPDQTTPAALPPTPQVNPNGVSSLGVPLQTKEPQLAQYNIKTTSTGVPLQADLTTTAQRIFAESGGKLSVAQAYTQASKQMLKKAPLSAKAADAVSQNSILADKKITMAQEIRAVVRDAEEAGLALGPTWSDTASRVSTSIDTVFDAELNEKIGDVKSKISDLESRHVILIMQSSGMGTKAFDSEKESERLLKSGPTITATPKQLLQVADRLESEARQVQDENTLTQFFDVEGTPIEESKKLIAEYFADPNNKARIFDAATNSFILNKNREDPTKWANNKKKIDTQKVAEEVFSTPTMVPKTPTQPAPASPGSDTSTPFAAGKKSNASAFPAPSSQNGSKPTSSRGVDYNQTPASLKDLKSIAEVAAEGGNIRQFQSGSSVPIKLDKATPDLVARVIGAESSGKPNAVSPTGVKGLMQVTKPTFREVANENPDPEISSDRADPVASVVRGTQYLNKLLKHYNGNVDLSLASYNAGMGTVDDILEAQGLSTSRATIDMIGPYLPTTQNTLEYVKRITSRGRIGGEQESTGEGFFKTAGKVVEALNPFSVAEAEAEEFSPNAKPFDPENPGPAELTIGMSTDSEMDVPDLDTSPRGDVPPVSEIQAALQEFDIANSAFPTAGRAVKFIRESVLGKWMGEAAKTEVFAGMQNFSNAVTFGLFDEGMSTLTNSMGLDGKLVQNQIKTTLQDFRKDYPKSAMMTDILGSVVGGAGALKVLRALRPAAAAAPTIEAMTVGEGAKIGASQAAARGFGEGETPGQRVIGAATGAVVGGALGGGAGLVSKAPVVGAPSVAGATIGAIAGGMGGGQGSDVVTGAAVGAGLGAGGALAVKLSPIVQKGITAAVTQINTHEGFKTFGTMMQKLITGKSPAETVANLDGSEAYLMDVLQHLPRGRLKSILNELKTVQKDNPQVPARLVDMLNDADINSLVKVMTQFRGNKEVSSKINTFLQERMAGQLSRVNAEVGPQELVEQSARKVIGLLEGKVKGATASAITATEGIYATAEATTPRFVSPKITELLTIPKVKEAVGLARTSLEGTMPKAGKPVERTAAQLGMEIQRRVEAGQPIDDLLNPAPPVKKLAANSYKVLAEARRKFRDEIIPAASGDEKRRLGIVFEDLTAEMERLNPEFATANAEYTAQLAKVDMLKTPQIEAIRDLADGNVQLALGKIMRLPPTDLQDVVNAVGNPKAMQDLARGYLRQKTAAAFEGKDVASKLIPDGEWKNLETLLGKAETDSLKATISAESKIAKSGRSLGGGSDTGPKLNAQAALNEISGQSSEPMGTLANISGPSWRTVVSRSMAVALRAFKREGSPEAVNELAETLVLSADKGVKAMENILKARGYQAAEIRALRPQLAEWNDTARGAGAGIGASLTGQAEATTQKKRKK